MKSIAWKKTFNEGNLNEIFPSANSRVFIHKVHYLHPHVSFSFSLFFYFLRDVSMNMKGKENAIFLLSFRFEVENFILKIAFTFHFPSFFVHSRAGKGLKNSEEHSRRRKNREKTKSKLQFSVQTEKRWWKMPEKQKYLQDFETMRAATVWVDDYGKGWRVEALA